MARPEKSRDERPSAAPKPGGAGRICIVDDDESVVELLGALFRAQGYRVESFDAPGKFLDRAAQSPPDLILLDLELPGIGGWELLKALKEHPTLRASPVIIVSAKYRDTKDVVRGLQLGADDYVSHPAPPEFLLARAEALLRRAAWRAGFPAEQSIRLGTLTIEPDSHSVLIEDKEVRLTPLEFDLLVYLVKNRNRVLTRGLILETVWKSDSSVATRTVDKHVESLRKKLGTLGGKIDTVIGVGYILRD